MSAKVEKSKIPMRYSNEWQDEISKKKRQKPILKENLQKFKSVYVLALKDIRLNNLKDVANFPEWRSSQFWFGKNKIARQVFRKQKIRLLPHIDELAERIKGNVGLLFTNSRDNKVFKWFNNFSVWDFPQPGHEVDITIQLNKGPLEQFQPEIEPFLRKLGMPTTVIDGSVVLVEDYEVCRGGTILTPKQVQILELLGEKISVYTLKVLGKWTQREGYQVVDDTDEAKGEEETISDYEEGS